MIRVSHDGDKVVTDLGDRRRDVLLSPLEGERYADALEENAARAEREPAGLLRGEPWGVRVTNFDRRVALRFDPPPGAAGKRVPMPAAVARRVADLVRTNCNMAGYGLRIERG